VFSKTRRQKHVLETSDINHNLTERIRPLRGTFATHLDEKHIYKNQRTSPSQPMVRCPAPGWSVFEKRGRENETRKIERNEYLDNLEVLDRLFVLVS